MKSIFEYFRRKTISFLNPDGFYFSHKGIALVVIKKLHFKLIIVGCVILFYAVIVIQFHVKEL